MIDWHSHVLPGMDDGSRSVEESLGLLKMQKSQGFDTVIATPHFYANENSLESFLEKRDASYARLAAELPPDAPEIILGAEVKYYPGISRMEGLKQLRIGQSKLLLLEMPFREWRESVIREVIDLSGKNGIQLVLAHVDRYFGMQDKKVWQRLREYGIRMQLNTEVFDTFFNKRRALKLLGDGSAKFIGTDCHNLTTRPPDASKALAAINKKLGDGFVAGLTEYGYSKLR